MAGFQVSIYGRFWVSTEAQDRVYDALARNKYYSSIVVSRRRRAGPVDEEVGLA